MADPSQLRVNYVLNDAVLTAFPLEEKSSTTSSAAAGDDDMEE